MPQPTRPILGYLTTLWTPPAACSSVEVDRPTSPWWGGYQGQTCNTAAGFYLSDAPDCWPPRTANAPAPHPPSSTFLSGWGFYSPGILCPFGFTTACVARYGETVSGWSLQFPLTVGETAAGCCPSGGYTCAYLIPDNYYGETYGPAQTCRLFATSTTTQVAPCIPSPTTGGDATVSAVLPYTLRHTDGSYTATSVVTSLPLFAPLIQINWRAEDRPNTIPTATTSISMPTGYYQEVNLSGGAIAGIVIGAVFVVVVTSIGIFFSARRKLKRKEIDCQNHELDGTAAQQHMEPQKPQQGIQEAVELPTKDSVRELPGHEVASELLHSDARS